MRWWRDATPCNKRIDMKFIRLATVYFEPIPEGWDTWQMTFDEVEVRAIETTIVEKKLQMLVVAIVDVPGSLELTSERLIVIPDSLRRGTEVGLENAANMIAIAEKCKRTISSPHPCIALFPISQESHMLLSKAKGFHIKNRGLFGTKNRIDIEHYQNELSDRFDGVALLAEALANDHATGRFHELLRFFERAFRCSSSKLIEPLSVFLKDANLGYSQDEVKRWVVDMRHPATHADTKEQFLLESDIRPIIRRMEQAAYYVLMNKEEWRSTSTSQRKIWIPTSGTSSANNELFVVRGTATNIEFQLLDPFGAYPTDLLTNIYRLPEGWWAKGLYNEKT